MAGDPIRTERLVVRPPVADDRACFVALFADPVFMEFSDGPLSAQDAERRFDAMLQCAGELVIGKRPILERSSDTVIGYVGADFLEVDGVRECEFGYRLVEEARGHGFATEAGRALLAVWAPPALVVVIHPENTASIRTSERLGFRWWKWGHVNGKRRYVGRLAAGERTASTRTGNIR